MIQKPREIRDLYLRMRGDQSRITVVQVSTPTNFKRNEIQVSLISHLLKSLVLVITYLKILPPSLRTINYKL